MTNMIDSQLKVKKEDIILSNEFTEIKYKENSNGKLILDKDGKPIIESSQQLVSYGYKSGEIALPLDNEIIEKRTENIVIRNLGGNKRSAQSGYNFYKEGNDWKQIKFAVTTKEIFDKA